MFPLLGATIFCDAGQQLVSMILFYVMVAYMAGRIEMMGLMCLLPCDMCTCARLRQGWGFGDDGRRACVREGIDSINQGQGGPPSQ
jgi:hypothetical protein